jgi:hypothetical protein
MKYKLIIHKLTALVLVSSILFSGCTKKDFGDVNTNPYASSEAVTSILLTSALRGLAMGTSSVTNDATGSLYAQYISDVQYTDGGRFLPINFNYADFYRGPLINLQKIIEINTDPETSTPAQVNGSNANQIAIARILKAFYFFHLTNRWGDIPYSEALKQGENLVPTFDHQEDIYADLFKELKEAVAQFDGGKAVTGDIFLSGNASRWKVFANSVRLIMALRLSKADPAKGKAEFLEAKTAGVAMTNAATFKFLHLAETANQNAWYGRYLTRFDFAISTTFLNYLNSVNDPRLPVFADKPTDGNAKYVGMPYGLAVTSGIANNSVSYIGSSLRKQNSPETILSAAHVLFTLAEGEKLGWNTAGASSDVQAETFYKEGIKVSMEQFESYAAGTYATYIAQPNVAYTPADAIKKISEQRWVSLYLNGYEAWNEWRRTGFPVLTPGPAPLSIGGQIPRRQAYPTTERDLNLANYNAVVTDQGPDVVATKMYIDK